MRSIAVTVLGTVSLLAGCLGTTVIYCENGAICPDGTACTEQPICAVGDVSCEQHPVCGEPRLVAECGGANKQDFAGCAYSESAAGTCRYGVCEMCTADRAGCRLDNWSAMTPVDNSDLYGVWIGSATHAFAIGKGGALWHYDGWQWSAVENGPVLGADNVLTGIWGVDDANLYVVANDGQVFKFDGTSWPSVAKASVALNAVWGNGPNNVIAVGAAASIFQFNGTTWSESKPVSNLAVPFLGIGGVDANDIYVVGNFGTIVHYDSLGWALADGNDPQLPRLVGVWARSPSEVFVPGWLGTSQTTVLLEGAGMSWTQASLPVSIPTVNLYAAWGTADDVFAVGNRTIARKAGTTWGAMTTPPPAELHGIAGNDGIVISVGLGGTIWRLTLPN